MLHKYVVFHSLFSLILYLIQFACTQDGTVVPEAVGVVTCPSGREMFN